MSMVWDPKQDVWIDSLDATVYSICVFLKVWIFIRKHYGAYSPGYTVSSMQNRN